MANGYLQDVSWVEFYGRPIVTAYSEDLGYVVPMKHIVEDHLGLQWEKQREKLNRSVEILDDEGGSMDASLFHPVVVDGMDLSDGITAMDHEYPEEDIPVFLPNQRYTCLPMSELNIFLAQISIRHVKLEVRRNLYLYQSECATALHEYWFRGMSVNKRKDPSRISSDRHDWCPREMSHRSLKKGCERFAAYALRQHGVEIEAESIMHFCNNAISDVLDLESGAWDRGGSTLAFILAFMERAAFDILYMSMEKSIEPSAMPEILERNINNAWEHVGTLVISVQPSYNAFAGVGRGAERELI